MIEAQEKIGVVGAGLMGAEIALNFALAGHSVLLHDRTDEFLAAARQRLATILDRGIPAPALPPPPSAGARARTGPGPTRRAATAIFAVTASKPQCTESTSLR